MPHVSSKGELWLVRGVARATGSEALFALLPARGGASHDVEDGAVADVGVAQGLVVGEDAALKDEALGGGACRGGDGRETIPQRAGCGVRRDGQRVVAGERHLHGDPDGLHWGGRGWTGGVVEGNCG